MDARCAVVILGCIVAIMAIPLAEHSERSLRIGSSSGGTSSSDSSSSGYSVSFVPLFSLIANFFPRLFSRFSGINQTGSQEFGRSYKELEASEHNYIKVNSSVCSPSHLGQWEDTSDCQRFYTCEVNSEPPFYCDAEYGKAISNKRLEPATSQIVWSTEQAIGQHLQIERYTTPCIIMTLYQCPNKSVYYKESKRCITHSDANISKLCHM